MNLETESRAIEELAITQITVMTVDVVEDFPG